MRKGESKPLDPRAFRDEQTLKRLKKRAVFAQGSTVVDELILEMTGTKTIVFIMFLFAVGVSLTTSFVLAKHPGCFGLSTAKTLEQEKAPGELPSLRNGAVVGSVDTAKKKEEEMSAKRITNKCTDEQMKILQKQLPGGECRRPPWNQKCSFTQATTTGCRDSIWAREFFAKTDLSTPFRSAFIGYSLDDIDTDFPIDTMKIGSRMDKKQGVDEWREAAGQGARCKTPIDTTQYQDRKAQAYITTSSYDEITRINNVKEKLGLSNEEMPVSLLNADNNKAIREFIIHTSQAGGTTTAGGQPIHWLMGTGCPMLLSPFSTKSLSKAWYLEFKIDWRGGSWETCDTSLILQDILPKNGFVCYWAGTNNLWRITDCWQNHYAFKSWSYVACVNTGVEEAKGLYDRMEEIFHETLKKDHSF